MSNDKSQFISYKAERLRQYHIHLIHLTKKERKGKTPEEMFQLRLNKYEAKECVTCAKEDIDRLK